MSNNKSYKPLEISHNNPNKAIVDNLNIRGGVKIFDDTNERDTLPLDKRSKGLYYVINDSELLYYNNTDVTDSEWTNSINWVVANTYVKSITESNGTLTITDQEGNETDIQLSTLQDITFQDGSGNSFTFTGGTITTEGILTVDSDNKLQVFFPSRTISDGNDSFNIVKNDSITISGSSVSLDTTNKVINIADKHLSSASLNAFDLELNLSDGSQILLDVEDLYTDTNRFTTGATLNNNVLTFDYNSGLSYDVDLNDLSDDYTLVDNTDNTYSLKKNGTTVNTIDLTSFLDNTDTTYTLNLNGNVVELVDDTITVVSSVDLSSIISGSDIHLTGATLDNSTNEITFTLDGASDIVVDLTPVLMEATLDPEIFYIDELNGDDSSAEAGNISKPYQTFQALVSDFTDKVNIKEVVTFSDVTISNRLPSYNITIRSTIENTITLDSGLSSGTDTLFNTTTTALGSTTPYLRIEGALTTLVVNHYKISSSNGIRFEYDVDNVIFDSSSFIDDVKSFKLIQNNLTFRGDLIGGCNLDRSSNIDVGIIENSNSDNLQLFSDFISATSTDIILNLNINSVNAPNCTFKLHDNTNAKINARIFNQVSLDQSNTSNLTDQTVGGATDIGLVSWYFYNTTLDGKIEFKGNFDVYGNVTIDNNSIETIFNCPAKMRFFEGGIVYNSTGNVISSRKGKKYEFYNFFINITNSTSYPFYWDGSNQTYTDYVAEFNGDCSIYHVTDAYPVMFSNSDGSNEPFFNLYGSISGNISLTSDGSATLVVNDTSKSDVNDPGLIVGNDSGVEQFTVDKNEMIRFKGDNILYNPSVKEVEFLTEKFDGTFHVNPEIGDDTTGDGTYLKPYASFSPIYPLITSNSYFDKYINIIVDTHDTVTDGTVHALTFEPNLDPLIETYVTINISTVVHIDTPIVELNLKGASTVYTSNNEETFGYINIKGFPEVTLEGYWGDFHFNITPLNGHHIDNEVTSFTLLPTWSPESRIKLQVTGFSSVIFESIFAYNNSRISYYDYTLLYVEADYVVLEEPLFEMVNTTGPSMSFSVRNYIKCNHFIYDNTQGIIKNYDIVYQNQFLRMESPTALTIEASNIESDHVADFSGVYIIGVNSHLYALNGRIVNAHIKNSTVYCDNSFPPGVYENCNLNYRFKQNGVNDSEFMFDMDGTSVFNNMLTTGIPITQKYSKYLKHTGLVFINCVINDYNLDLGGNQTNRADRVLIEINEATSSVPTDYVIATFIGNNIIINQREDITFDLFKIINASATSRKIEIKGSLTVEGTLTDVNNNTITIETNNNFTKYN